MDYGITKLGARTYTDNPTKGSGFFYRESEAHAKVHNDIQTLRDNADKKDLLF
jgi:hypothetical protein